MRRILLIFLFLCQASWAADRPNVLFMLRNSKVAPAAFRTFQTRIGASACDCAIVNENVPAERLKKAQIVFMEHPSEEFLKRNKATGTEAVRNGTRFVTDIPDFVQRAWDIDIPVPLTVRLMGYWDNGGEENMLGFFLAAYQEASGLKNLDIPPPQQMPRTGVYHPDAPKTFSNLNEYLQWYRAAKPKQGKLAAIEFFESYYYKRDLDFIDALLRELEKQGLAAAGVFGWPHSSLQSVYNAPENDPLKVLLAFTFVSAKPEDEPFLEKQNVHTIGLMMTQESYAEWAADPKGVTPERVGVFLSDPERNGVTDPLMVSTTEPGGDGETARTAPIKERVEMAARRARRWVDLSEKPNPQKRLAMLYYNNPPGKGNIGASYLNLAPSIRAVLETLQNAGYSTGGELPSADHIMDQLEKVGRNIENWAPGELNRMVQQGSITLLPVERYRQWFDKLPKEFQKSINDRWGPPEVAELMVWKSAEGRKFFVIPGIQFGNIFLGPQLLRSSSAEYTNVQQNTTLPPHHGYVAAYLYYQNQFKADAVIHMGRHGTLEWLPGKNAGQAGWDASEVLLGDLPDAYYYIMDGDGEAIQARRRAAAVLISHLTPMLARTGNQERFKALHNALHRWEETHETSPLLGNEYAKTAVAEIERLNIREQLGIDDSNEEEMMAKVHRFLDAMEDAPTPLGLPILGGMPSEDRQRAGLTAFLGTAFMPAEMDAVSEYLPDWSNAIFDGHTVEAPAGLSTELREKATRAIEEGKTWIRRVQESPARELTALTRVLNGEFLPSGPVGDPLAVPDALPSGRNLHQGDPRTWPTKAAWEVGKKLADQLIERHRKQHGRYPETVSMILWMGETGRHQGAMEAQALYLMGVEPEWNPRGVVEKLKLIPDDVLGRPRVNVVFTASGLYRDGLADKIIMLDRAARLAATAGDNALSRHNREVKQTLLANGVGEEDADEFAGARVFTEAPGAYGFGLSNFVEQSRDKDEPETMAQLYLRKMNFVYSEKTWGKSVPKLLESQLRGNEAILHSSSSNLYGAVDNDDVYQFMGGLRVASQAVGAQPELLFNNMRRAGDEKLEDSRGFIATELNSRNWNPQWISEMQKEGYSGGRVMSRAFEYLYGWQATAPESISPAAWKKMYDVYVADEYGLGLNAFFDKANPAAKQAIVARLLEIDRQGTYQFSAPDKAALVKEYVRLVTHYGVACSANVCGNPRLQSAVMRDAARMASASSELSRAAVEQFRKRFQEAVNPRQSSPSQAAAASNAVDKLRQFTIRFVKIANFGSTARRVVAENLRLFVVLQLILIAAGSLVAYARRRPAQWSELHLGVKGDL
jgi:cobaltochelatase CobN